MLFLAMLEHQATLKTLTRRGPVADERERQGAQFFILPR